MPRINGYVVCCSLAIIAFGCVATPRQARDIDDARSAIRQVEAMSLANEVAADEITEARVALDEAESLAKMHGAAREISNAAHLAQRHAEIAEQQVAVAEAKRSVELAEKQRQAESAAESEEKTNTNATSISSESEEIEAKSATQGALAEIAGRESIVASGPTFNLRSARESCSISSPSRCSPIAASVLVSNRAFRRYSTMQCM